MKLILYILIIWFLVRVISRLFMPRVQNRRRQSVLYQIFSQLQNQSNNGSGSSSDNSGNSASKSGSKSEKNLDDIEEAEFEDVTDEDKK